MLLHWKDEGNIEKSGFLAIALTRLILQNACVFQFKMSWRMYDSQEKKTFYMFADKGDN